MNERFIRSEMLLGEEAMQRLKNSHVAVFGLGGVGSWCAEALARAGVGELTLIDSDTLSRSNINRQLYALESTLGTDKTAAAAGRINDINPDAVLHPITGTYCAADRERFVAEYDYVADCIDLVSCKLDLIETCLARSLPVISALGTGNKNDPSLLEITDISKTKGDALARVIRKELRARGIEHHTVVYSPEEPMSAAQVEAPPPGRRSVPGSLIWVPASAGLMMAGHIVNELIS